MKDIFELAYRYAIPSVRGSLVRKLVSRGMAESEAAKVLGLSRSAVSRYVRSERGRLVDLTRFNDVRRLLEELADEVIEGKLDYYSIQGREAEIVIYVLARKYFCQFHKRLEPEIDVSRCEICPTVFAKS